MYLPSLYVPSKVVRANPETLSGLLLIVGKHRGDIDFFQFMSLEPKRLEEVVKTFPGQLREGGMKMIDSQNRAQNGSPTLFNVRGYANTTKAYLNPEIKGADRYDLGFVNNWYTFLWDCLEVAVGYFSEYDSDLMKENLYKT